MKPQDVTDIDMAFPAKVSHLMPTYEEIPDEFKRGSNKWNRLVSTWFFSGFKGAKFVPKDGIEPNHALRHLKCIMGSFEPKHEHKEAAVAYLMSQWFEDVALAARPAPAKEQP